MHTRITNINAPHRWQYDNQKFDEGTLTRECNPTSNQLNFDSRHARKDNTNSIQHLITENSLEICS
jgi:hypothetical protein